MTVKKVLACSSPIIKTDKNGRKYRWHCGVGLGDADPSRHYIDTGEEFFETQNGLKSVGEVKEMIGECDEFETAESTWIDI